MNVLTSKPFFVIKTYYSVLFVLTILFIFHRLLNVYNELQQRVSSIEAQIVAELNSASDVLHLISDSKELRNYIDTKTLQSKNIVIEDFLQVARNNYNYDQIRYIDEKGQEKIRINYTLDGPQSVSNNQLSDKSNRYYFLDTMKLSKGDFFISPLDLNVENGKIEEPHKPTVRLATKVYDSNDNPAGIVIINYNATTILDFFCTQAIVNCKVSKIYFLNSNGYMFVSPIEEETWGFMYPDRQDATFQNKFPRAWEKVTNKNQGISLTSEGIFLFVKVHPIQDIQKHTDSTQKEFSYISNYLSVNDFYLIVLLHAETSNLLRQFLIDYKYPLLILYGVPPVMYFVTRIKQKK